MKAGRVIVSTMLTAGVLAAGFFAPEAVTVVMDRQLETETAQFATESIQVESMEEISDVLRLVGSSYNSYDLEYGVVREYAEMEELEQKAVESMKNAGLLDEISFSSLDARPFIAISYSQSFWDAQGYGDTFGNTQTYTSDGKKSDERYKDSEISVYTEEGVKKEASDAEVDAYDEEEALDSAQAEDISEGSWVTQGQNSRGNTAAVLWNCALCGERGEYLNLIIDDTSGKMVSFTLQQEEISLEERIRRFEEEWPQLYEEGEAFLRQMMDQAGRFCEEYYELKFLSAEFEGADENEIDTMFNGRMYFEDSRGEQLSISFRTLADAYVYLMNF